MLHLAGPAFLGGDDDGARASSCTVEAEAYRRVLRSRCDGITLRELRPGGDVGGDGMTYTESETGCMVSMEQRQSRCRKASRLALTERYMENSGHSNKRRVMDGRGISTSRCYWKVGKRQTF